MILDFYNLSNRPVAEFIDPGLGDKDNSGIGLSFRHARLHGWRAGTTIICRTPELTLSPSQESMNSATACN